MGKVFQSVWDAIGDNPSEVEDLKARSRLMHAIQGHVKKMGWNKTYAAEKAGIKWHRMNALLLGRIHRFKLDELQGIAKQMRVEII